MKTYLIYGFAMALAGAILAVVCYLLGWHSSPEKLTAAQWLGTIGGFAIGVACITLGVKARRAEIPASEEFGYAHALGAGFMISLFAALFGIGSSLLYAKVINPDFPDVIVQAQMAQMEAKGVPAAQMEAAEKIIRRMTSPGVQAGLNFVVGLFIGTVISLLVAAFLKRPAEEIESPAPPTLEPGTK